MVDPFDPPQRKFNLRSSSEQKQPQNKSPQQNSSNDNGNIAQASGSGLTPVIIDNTIPVRLTPPTTNPFLEPGVTEVYGINPKTSASSLPPLHGKGISSDTPKISSPQQSSREDNVGVQNTGSPQDQHMQMDEDQPNKDGSTSIPGSSRANQSDQQQSEHDTPDRPVSNAPIIINALRLHDYAPIDAIPGTTLAKLNIVNRKFFSVPGFMGARVIKIKKDKYMRITFSVQDSFDCILQNTYTWSDDQSPAPVPTQFLSMQQLRPKKVFTPDEKAEEKRRTVQVLDIPLFIKKSDIHRNFEAVGEIDFINVQVKSALYQTAYVIFKDVANTKFFYDTWSHVINSHVVRVIPLSLTEEQRKIRNQFTLKLSGLPPNTLAVDLKPSVKLVQGKTVFIPRNPKTYKPLRYAYISFTTAQDALLANNQSFSRAINVDRPFT
ncbi:hypothetical protein C1645_828962 [Glomus cerebriforme]|uniref:RRM domain-containing protein n=1 Tax=Glomus cerebriforme TaxID=658196 RepID=A0A397SKJ0_9GLOM|nr:hypothetical protein C1645_828962 [Glomus cerebriforme]